MGLLIELTGEIRLAPSENALCTESIQRDELPFDDRASLFDYSVSDPSAFNGMRGDDRVALESRSVETQTDFPPRKPPRPLQSSLRRPRIDLRSRSSKKQRCQ